VIRDTKATMSAPTPPQTELLLSPLLASLPAAAVSPEPSTALLPLLSPILRQRVQLLSGASSEPWLPLLCYDSAKALQLGKVVKSERLEPHPVSGEVEVDWESEVQVRYKRLDEETLQALVNLAGLGLSVRLVWCVNDEVGGGDGWRIGEVGILDNTESWGWPSISAAEEAFETTTHTSTQNLHAATNSDSLHTPGEDEDDDDDYWAQYDKTPSGNTPAPKDDRTRPAPMTSTASTTDEDSYYAQYLSVQPAMDNHDPDEAKENGEVESSLGGDEVTRELQSTLSPASHHPELNETSAAWSERPLYTNGVGGQIDGLLQPRPSSSSSGGSSGSETVERLERQAAGREQSETGIKQHIGTSIKSLWRLAKVAGIERAEFDRLVRTELDCLSMMDEDDI
jgi:hypothetical protein